jgi:hypothetical protein
VSEHNTARTYIGYGFCYGDGYGDGLGFGYGYADGYGHGLGFGFGYADGYGHGDGLGDGHGHGYGKIIASIASLGVKIRPPFNVVIVGCQAHTVEHWRQHWREIAQGEDVDVTKEEVAKILRLVEAT